MFGYSQIVFFELCGEMYNLNNVLLISDQSKINFFGQVGSKTLVCQALRLLAYIQFLMHFIQVRSGCSFVIQKYPLEDFKFERSFLFAADS